MKAEENKDTALHLQENFEDFFETSLCGYLTADKKGVITRANHKMSSWLSFTTTELEGKRFTDLLAIGSKIYYETHLAPLLRMQGFFDEVVLDLSSNVGQKMRVMVNAIERRDQDDQPLFIRFVIIKASDRLLYEQNLQTAKAQAENKLIREQETVTLREQLIAVLGHDLRNPLAAVSMAVDLLEDSVTAENAFILQTLRRSNKRMTELVNNIMDFAHTRLGDGIVLSKRKVLLNPVLEQVVRELQLSNPEIKIDSVLEIDKPILCDSDRIAQLLSNLLANALHHGAVDSTVKVCALQSKTLLKISVTNRGNPIPTVLHEALFTPFTRDKNRGNLKGLGLGLYICSEITKAHGASLTFTSSEKETCFTYKMKL